MAWVATGSTISRVNQHSELIHKRRPKLTLPILRAFESTWKTCFAPLCSLIGPEEMRKPTKNHLNFLLPTVILTQITIPECGNEFFFSWNSFSFTANASHIHSHQRQIVFQSHQIGPDLSSNCTRGKPSRNYPKSLIQSTWHAQWYDMRHDLSPTISKQNQTIKTLAIIVYRHGRAMQEMGLYCANRINQIK